MNIQDYILKARGGSGELTNEKQERLVKSILAKVPESGYREISINKFFKKILKVIDPVISDQSALQGIIFLNEEYTIERVN